MIRSRNRARGFSGGGAAPWYTEGKADGVDPSLWADFVNNRYAVNGVEAPFADVFTYTRASTATYFDASGVLQTASANTPRFDHDPITHAAKGILIEESRTNNILSSSNFTHASWTNSGGNPVISPSLSPDGVSFATTIEDTSAAANHNIGFSKAVANDSSSYILSIFVKKTSGGTSPTFAINFSLLGGTPVYLNIRCNTDDGSMSTGTAQDYGSYWRIFKDIQNNSSGNTTLSINFFAASNTHGLFSDTTTAMGTATIWGAQLEAGSFPTSYIPTTTAAVTRAADQCSNTSSNVITPSSWMSSTAHTLYTERTHTGSVDGNSIYLGNSAGNNLFMQNYYFLNNQFFVVDNLVAQASWLVGTQPVNTPYKRASSGQANDYTDYRNGVSLGTDASGTMPLFDRLVVADANANAAHVKELRYYPIRVTNSELARITT